MRTGTDADGNRDVAAGEVFGLFPHGIILLDGERRVLDLNDASKSMLGALVSEWGGASHPTCCQLFGCRTPGGALETICLSELAFRGSGRSSEIRVELPAGAPVGAVWITPAPFPVPPAQALLVLRPADRGDRRRRNSAHWVPPSRLSIFTLGRTIVQSPEGLLSGAWLGRRPGQVFKYLVCERHRLVSAEEIAEVLWPGGEQRGVTNVRYLIYTLRGHLEPRRGKREPSRFVLAKPGGYRLNLEVVDVDADEFERGVRAGLDLLARGELSTARETLRHAMSLYAGDFLAEDRYALWVLAERDRLRDIASNALRALARLYREDGDLDAAGIQLERLADMHPFDPDIQREALTLAMEQGRHTIARRRYGVLRRRLIQEFGQEPSFDLADIAASLQRTEQESPLD